MYDIFHSQAIDLKLIERFAKTLSELHVALCLDGLDFVRQPRKLNKSSQQLRQMRAVLNVVANLLHGQSLFTNIKHNSACLYSYFLCLSYLIVSCALDWCSQTYISGPLPRHIYLLFHKTNFHTNFLNVVHSSMMFPCVILLIAAFIFSYVSFIEFFGIEKFRI